MESARESEKRKMGLRSLLGKLSPIFRVLAWTPAAQKGVVPTLFRGSFIVVRSTLLALFIAEGCLRTFAPQPIMPRYVESAPWGIRKNLSYVDGFHRTREFDYALRTNSQGFRGTREYDPKPAPGVYRVVVIGDSVTLGYGVKYDDTYAFVLEQLLRERGVNAEVINMGVSGFGTAEEIIQYRHVGKKYHPNLVVLGFFQNDHVNNKVSGLYKLNDGKLEVITDTYQPGIYIRDRLTKIPGYTFLSQHSHLVTFARNMASKRIVAKTVDREFPEGTDKSDDSVALTRELLNLLSRDVHRSGAAFVAANITSSKGKHPFRSTFPDKLDLAENSVAFDLTPALRKALDAGQKIYFTYDTHPTVAGHRVIANALLVPMAQADPKLWALLNPGKSPPLKTESDSASKSRRNESSPAAGAIVSPQTIGDTGRATATATASPSHTPVWPATN